MKAERNTIPARKEGRKEGEPELDSRPHSGIQCAQLMLMLIVIEAVVHSVYLFAVPFKFAKQIEFTRHEH